MPEFITMNLISSTLNILILTTGLYGSLDLLLQGLSEESCMLR